MDPPRAESARLIAILHMAFDFASMGRVFGKGTKGKFLERLHGLLPGLAQVRTKGDFESLHSRYCEWGCRSIRSRHRDRQRASYGQVAKTLNVVLKVVVVSYCMFPNQRQAKRLLPWLHPGQHLWLRHLSGADPVLGCLHAAGGGVPGNEKEESDN